MKPEDLPVAEVNQRCRFSSTEACFRHVIKHVVEGRDERWHRVVDAELLSKARDEHAEGRLGPALRRLTVVYEALLSDAIQKSCQAGNWHCHLVRYTLSKCSELVATKQVIDAWPPEDRLFVVAGAVVRNGAQRPYRIWTGFRPWPELRGKAILRAGQEKAMNRLRLFPQRLLALHTGT